MLRQSCSFSHSECSTQLQMARFPPGWKAGWVSASAFVAQWCTEKGGCPQVGQVGFSPSEYLAQVQTAWYPPAWWTESWGVTQGSLILGLGVRPLRMGA